MNSRYNIIWQDQFILLFCHEHAAALIDDVVVRNVVDDHKSNNDRRVEDEECEYYSDRIWSWSWGHLPFRLPACGRAACIGERCLSSSSWWVMEWSTMLELLDLVVEPTMLWWKAAHPSAVMPLLLSSNVFSFQLFAKFELEGQASAKIDVPIVVVSRKNQISQFERLDYYWQLLVGKSIYCRLVS